MLFDYFKISVKNLRARGTRTLLTMIGIVIGIAAIVALVSMGSGLKVAINEQFEKMGVDKLLISPGSGDLMSSAAFSSGVIKLTDKDLGVIQGTKGIKEAGGMLYGIAGVKFKDKTKYGYIFGTPTDSTKLIIASMASVDIIDGRELRRNDKYKALIGRELYNGRYFGDEVKVGDTLEIMNYSFRVVGKFAPIGNPDDDSTVWIPLETAREIFGKPDSFDMIVAQVFSGENVDDTGTRVKTALRRSRNVKSGEEDFSVSTTQELMDTLNTILDAVQIVFIGIAAISLVVGGIGIMNTMYTQVMERTTEIGIMKAIGGTNRDIMLIFLIESGLLGMAGGAIGVGIGVGLSMGISSILTATLGVEYLKAYFPLYLVLGALGFSFVVGSLSGVLPAIRASRLRPVDALRWE